MDRWQEPGDEAHTDIPVLSSDPLDDVRYRPVSIFSKEEPKYKYEFANNRWQMYNKSNLRVVNGSHLRLRNVSLSYRMPSEYVQKIGLTNAVVRLDAYNLFLISSSDLRGQDPAQMSLGSRTTPPLPSFAFTIDLSL